jgi:rhomboid protease GluP
MPGTDLLENLLRECARQRPTPVFPAELAHATGMNLEQIEAAFDHLRTMKLVFLTDWIQGHGRGFIITEDGVHVLTDHVLLDRLRFQPVSPEPGVLSSRPTPRDVEMNRDQEVPAEPRPAAEDRAAAVQKALLRPGQPLVTYVLSLAMVCVFLIGLNMAMERQVQPLSKYLGIMPDNQVMIIHHDLGMLIPPDLVVNHEWWRLWAYAFVQGWGLLGLFLGVVYLYSLGMRSESMWGPVRFLGLFLTSTLGGSFASLFWDLSAMSSYAADCGLLAAQVIWLIANHGYLPKEAATAWKANLFSNLIFFVILSAILATYVPGYTPAVPLGGAAAGALFAIPALLNRYYDGAVRWAGLAGMIAVPVVLLIVIANSFDTIKENFQERLANIVRVQNQAVVDAAKAKEKARREAAERDLHGKALNTAERVYRNKIQVLLARDKRGNEFANPAFINDTQQDLKAACDELKKAIDYLEKEKPFGKHNAQAIALDRQFHDFLENFLGALAKPREFVGRRVELIEQANAVLEKLDAWHKLAAP